MKNLFLLSILYVVLISACKKDDFDPLEQQREEERIFNEQLAKDSVTIRDYLIQRELPYSRNQSGLYYNILEPGQGGIVYGPGTRVQVKFKALLLDGTVVDSTYATKSTNFVLGEVITAFQMGVQLIQPGGKVILYVPSGYVFGGRTILAPGGEVLAPPNSNFIFELELLQAI